jgi:Flp pilus assembly protein TadD
VNLGLFYEETGDHGRAESEYRAGLRIEPFFTPAAVNLADLYRRQGRDDEGARVLSTTIARTPNAAALHYALGLLLVRRGDRAGGLGELQRADQLSPNDPDFAYGLGVALYSSGRPDEGIAVLERLVSARPAHATALATLDVYRRERGRR